MIGITIALLTAFASTDSLSTAYSRWQTPVTQSELTKLDQYACVDEFISKIPPNSRVKIIAQIDEWDQRVLEIGYPRIYFTDSGQDLFLVVSSIPQDFAPYKCGSDLYLGINENLRCDANLFYLDSQLWHLCSLEG